MKTIIIGPRICDEASGVSPAVMGLCNSLHESGAAIELHVVAPVLKQLCTSAKYPLHVYNTWPIIKKFAISPSMYRGLRKACITADILHNNSIWIFPNIIPGFVTKNTACKLIISPHGTLSRQALSRAPLLKKILWLAGQRYTLHKAACFHATAQHECDDIRRAGFTAPVALIPHGVAIPHDVNKQRKSPRRKLLYLSRIHPIKGIPKLLAAWEKLQNEYPQWELVIAGPGENRYDQEMQMFCRDRNLKRVTFPGPLFGEKKEQAYTTADLYVLPSLSENFAYTVAEALSFATPVVVTSAAPWSGVKQYDCGWSIDPTEQALYVTLRAALAKPQAELDKKGINGRDWIAREFSWNTVAQKMFATYEWVAGRGDKPEYIIK